MVSTDCDVIAHASQTGDMYRRPQDLSGDQVGDLPVLRDALLAAEAEDDIEYDAIVMLQPTSPMRTIKAVEKVIDYFIAESFDVVLTISESDSKAHPYKQFSLNDKKIELFDTAGEKIIARQQLQPLYHRDGICYIFKREYLLKSDILEFHNTGYVISEGINISIDTIFDLKLCELMISGAFKDEN